MRVQVAVIGAGLAGLSAARHLHDAGVQVAVFDKGRGPGGRASTRRSPSGQFDHGAQYFSVRSAGFGRAVEKWCDEGVVARWAPRVLTSDTRSVAKRARFVPLPGMSSLAEHLAADMALHSSIQVTAVTRKDTRWQLSTATDVLCSADAVVIALPASQVGALLSDLSADTRAALTAVQFAPCWAVMANAADPARDPGFDAAFISDGPLSWACRQIGKPGRSGTGWVLHGSPEWSTQFIDAPPEQVGAVLTEDFSRRFDIELLSNPVAHRWRFARVTQPAGRQPCLIDGRSGLVMCGDWCNGTRVEDAYLSGLAAGETVQAALAGSATRQRP